MLDESGSNHQGATCSDLQIQESKVVTKPSPYLRHNSMNHGFLFRNKLVQARELLIQTACAMLEKYMPEKREKVPQQTFPPYMLDPSQIWGRSEVTWGQMPTWLKATVLQSVVQDVAMQMQYIYSIFTKWRIPWKTRVLGRVSIQEHIQFFRSIRVHTIQEHIQFFQINPLSFVDRVVSTPLRPHCDLNISTNTWIRDALIDVWMKYSR